MHSESRFPAGGERVTSGLMKNLLIDYFAGDILPDRKKNVKR
jgi:hypothetical protein